MKPLIYWIDYLQESEVFFTPFFHVMRKRASIAQHENRNCSILYDCCYRYAFI